MGQLSTFIDNVVHRNLKEICRKQGRSMSSVLVNFVESYVNENKNLLEIEKQIKEEISEIPKEPSEFKIKIPEKSEAIKNEEEEISISNLISLENIKENENA